MLSAARSHMMTALFGEEEAALRNRVDQPTETTQQQQQQQQQRSSDQGIKQESESSELSGEVASASLDTNWQLGPRYRDTDVAPDQGRPMQQGEEPRYHEGVGLRNVPLSVPLEVVAFFRDSGVAGDDFEWTPADNPWAGIDDPTSAWPEEDGAYHTDPDLVNETMCVLFACPVLKLHVILL